MTDASVPQESQPTNEVYGIFAGPVDQPAVGRVANAAAIACSNRVTHIHLAFQTSGGSVPDGVGLYNIFRALPISLTLYNIGTIASAGVIAYLGAANRAVSSHGTFMIHRTMSPAVGVTSERLEAMMQSVAIDDARIEAIFASANLTLSKQQKKTHQSADLWLSSDEATKAGIATTLKEFSPPKGTALFYLGPV